MAEIKLRLNLDAEEVELVVDGEVALTSGKDVLQSWVRALNEKHQPTVDEPVEEKTVPADDKPVEPVNEPVPSDKPEDAVAVDTTQETVLDS